MKSIAIAAMLCALAVPVASATTEFAPDVLARGVTDEVLADRNKTLATQAKRP